MKQFAFAAALLAAGIVVGAFGRADAQDATPEFSGPWVVSTPQIGPDQQAYVVFDARLGRFAIYQITGNRVQLQAVREVGPDLELGFYGAQQPTPESLRKSRSQGTKNE